MTSDEFRELALGMPGAVEGAHMNHPDFRVNGRIFASLQSDERSGTLKLSPDEQREFMRRYPGMFSPASGAWGRQGWTNVRLAPADAAAVRGAILLASENAAGAARRRRTARRA